MNLVERSEVTETILDTASLRAAVTAADAGAVVVFEGVVRDHDPEATGQVTGLEYTAHPDATTFLREIIAEANTEVHNELDHGPLPVRVVAAHRIGHLEVERPRCLWRSRLPTVRKPLRCVATWWKK